MAQAAVEVYKFDFKILDWLLSLGFKADPGPKKPFFKYVSRTHLVAPSGWS